MAHKKAGGSTSYGRDSHGQRLGVKKYAGEYARIGNIIIRQRGTKVRPGNGIKRGNDDTLFAITEGFIKFTTSRVRRFTGAYKTAKYVHIIPVEKEVTATEAK